MVFGTYAIEVEAKPRYSVQTMHRELNDRGTRKGPTEANADFIEIFDTSVLILSTTVQVGLNKQPTLLSYFAFFQSVVRQRGASYINGRNMLNALGPC